MVPLAEPSEPDPVHAFPREPSEQALASVPAEGQHESDAVFRVGLPPQDPAVVSQGEPPGQAPVLPAGPPARERAVVLAERHHGILSASHCPGRDGDLHKTFRYNSDPVGVHANRDKLE